MVGIPGPILDGATRRTLKALGVAGVVLFKRNVKSLAQLRRLTAALHACLPGLLVGIDHEGGRVNRLPPPFTAFPPAGDVGRMGSARLSFAVGRAMGIEIASAGIDIDFAPVLDVLTHPKNRVIGDRAFGRTSQAVATLGLAFARGLGASGVIACAKHFPGHGATRGDSHVLLPRVTRSRRDLWRIDVAPFRAAVAAGLPCIMTAHVVYRALDPTGPASLSAPVIDGLLRRRLGYDGVVVSDDLEMGAVSNRCAPGDAAVRAVAAGTDLLLVCSDLGVATAARDALTSALADGRLPVARIREAFGRIQRLRSPRRRSATIRRLPIAAHAALAHALA